MVVATNSVLMLLVLFIVKHYIAEFILHQQQRYAPLKRRYGNLLDIEDAMLHGYMTVAILVTIYPWHLVVKVAAIEALIQYHISFFHYQFGSNDVKSFAYWAGFGLLQSLQFAMYVAIIYFLAG